MNSKTRIKVRVDALLAALRKRQAAEQAAYEAELTAYEAARKAWEKNAERDHRAALAAWLVQSAKDVRSGALAATEVTNRWGDWRLDAPKVADAPTEPKPPTSLNTAISQLEMAADDTITISGADFAAYME